uniref:Uncharacterized protein n=1 Tax=Candidatus Kentrum sp. DK TaxID=2126562 RepID=A0A450T2Q1_9GAMM|nr:MAG: hypothetical protein BECKDK2373C_GA0170839_108413 [Candidatus Kentron sp. DK]
MRLLPIEYANGECYTAHSGLALTGLVISQYTSMGKGANRNSQEDNAIKARRTDRRGPPECHGDAGNGCATDSAPKGGFPEKIFRFSDVSRSVTLFISFRCRAAGTGVPGTDSTEETQKRYAARWYGKGGRRQVRIRLES